MTTTEAVSPPRFALGPANARPGRFGRVQLVAIELTVVAVGAAVFAGRPVAVAATGATTAVVLALAFGRSRRRWLYEALAARWRLRRRQRAVASALRRPGDGATLAPLSPGLAIRAVTDRDTAIGVGQDEQGWFAAIAIAPWTGLSGNRQATLRLDRLARLLTDGSVPVSALQVATHRVPAPSAVLDERTPCASSYRELLGGVPGSTDEETWLAVRLDPADAAHAATQRGGGLTGVDRALAATLARVGVALNAAGVPHRVLDAAGLRQALTISGGLQQLAGTAPPGQPSAAQPSPVVERWTAWQAAGALHACFAIEDWPAQPGPELLAQLAEVPYATAVNTAIVLRPLGARRDDGLTVRALLRVVAAPDGLDGCVAHLLTTAGRLGVRLNRLDGEHGTGVYATAPTAAGLGGSAW